MQLPVHLFPIRTLSLLKHFHICTPDFVWLTQKSFEVLLLVRNRGRIQKSVLTLDRIATCGMFRQKDNPCPFGTPTAQHTCLFNTAYIPIIWYIALYLIVCIVFLYFVHIDAIYDVWCIATCCHVCQTRHCFTHHDTFWRIVTYDIYTYPWPTLMYLVFIQWDSIYQPSVIHLVLSFVSFRASSLVSSPHTYSFRTPSFLVDYSYTAAAVRIVQGKRWNSSKTADYHTSWT